MSSTFVVYDFQADSKARIDRFIADGGRSITLHPDCEKGPLPWDLAPDVYLIDLRYERGINVVRGKHPRIEGFWTQYSHLETGLARNITFSHSISDYTPIENWQSAPKEIQQAPYGTVLTSEEYKHLHNHYQNLHVETFNFARDLNAVSIWGDCGAFVPGAKSWGAFFSCRSWPLKWSGYTPEGAANYEDADFDAALVGIEVDVLNAGRDWGDPSPILTSSMAKVGVQIVGFGKKNTAAVEIRTEDSDDPSRTSASRRGAWHWGIIMRNALCETSTVLMSENGRVARGIDFTKTTFTDGAMRITGAGGGSGVMFDEGRGGEIYSDPIPGGETMTVRLGRGGLRFVAQDTGQEVARITSDGRLKVGDTDVRDLISRIEALERHLSLR